jgi:release factor glutamine methyltransferase
VTRPDGEPHDNLDDGPDDPVVARLRAAGCVFAEEEAALLRRAASGADLDRLVGRRAAGEPLEHVLGRAEFRGLHVQVDPGVFVPRWRSEHLAGQAAAAARAAVAAPVPGRPAVLVDLCCGTGALALAVAHEVPGLEVHACDVDPAAVACARRNLADVGPPPAQVHGGDLDAALPPDLAGRVGVLVANVPYVPTSALATLPAEARLHERRVALDGGADGLDVVRRVAALAPRWLAPGGVVLVETTDGQAAASAAAFAAAGLTASVVRSDEHEVCAVLGLAAG